MKKVVLAGVMLMIGAALISAIGLSVAAGGGYGLGLDRETGLRSNQQIYGFETETDESGDYLIYRYRYIGPGQGFMASGEVDIAFGDYFSTAFGGGYVKNYPLLHVHFDWDIPEDTFMSGSFVPLFLTFKGRVPVRRSSFYFGAGPALAVLAKSTVMTERGDGEYLETEMTSTPGWGFRGVTGLDLRITRRISFRVEARADQLTFKPRKAVVTKYTVNGVDRLFETFPNVSDREIEYVSELSEFKNNPVDRSAPRQELAYNFSADSVRAYLGIVVKVF